MLPEVLDMRLQILVVRASLSLVALLALGLEAAPASAAPKRPAISGAGSPRPTTPGDQSKATPRKPGHAPLRATRASAQAKPKDPIHPRRPAKHPAAIHRKCEHPAVSMERAELHETSSKPLTDCDGRPLREAQRALTSLARLRGTAKPKDSDFEDVVEDGEVLDRGVAMMHHGLLERLQRIADHFPDKTIGIVSGYRPASDGSMHQRARAIDIHLTGVDNVALVEFCRTLADTGCGYYPNSSFVHVDVRPPGSGKVTWIDASGPGEKPRYVSSWPPSKADLEQPVGAEGGDDPYTENMPSTPAAKDPAPETPE
jgi:hypothetical protein